MKRLFLILSAFMATCCYSQEKVALVVGNNNYGEYPLKNAVNDARLMQSTLQQLGFTVMLVTNARKSILEDSLLSFSRNSQNAFIRLFYYAGHGLQFDGQNYLIPTDASLDQKKDVQLQGIDLNVIMKMFQDKKQNGMSLFILDACRNNPFKNRSWGERGVNLDGLDIKKQGLDMGSFACFSADNGQKASDGDQDNGLYTKILAEEIVKPGVEINILFQRVRRKVNAESNGAQTPVEENRLTGDGFYFTPSENNVAVSGGAQQKLPEKFIDPVSNVKKVNYSAKDKSVVGDFTQLDNGQWVENNGQGSKFYFNEVGRDGQSIQLFDTARQLAVKLNFKEKLVYVNDNAYYVITDNVLDQNAAATENAVAKITEVFYRTADKTMFGHFNLTGDNEWVENERFKFKESARTKDSIILYDAGRGYEITLDFVANAVNIKFMDTGKSGRMYEITGYK